MNLNFVVPTSEFCDCNLEGNVSTTLKKYCQRESLLWQRIPDDLRLSRRLEIACEPDGGIGTKPKFMDHSVPLVIDVPKVHRVVPSRLVPVRTLHVRTSEVEVTGCKVFHQCSELSVDLRIGEKKSGQISTEETSSTWPEDVRHT